MKNLLKNKKFWERAGWTLLASVLLGILATMAYYISQVYTEAPVNEDISTVTSAQSISADELATDPEFDAEVRAALEDGELATLLAVDGSEDYGIVSRRYEDGVFEYEIIVSITDPPPGTFYEGWLAEGRIVSTGKLEREDTNTYSAIFTSTEDLSDLVNVIVTRETLADGLDGKPELHLLEGAFEKN